MLLVSMTLPGQMEKLVLEEATASSLAKQADDLLAAIN
ncbi:hypothetical protein SORDD16_00584 [Streptococcus oralis]|uniref:Uncharacterized protein n=1 Tax=Streptococcus oralis TaxID=1303 RepID=A0A139PET9_STROR|nr:hypothetical protein SORDD16_00584 [Streptococcus oralis]